MKEECIFTLHVKCGDWMVVGQTNNGQLRVIPIIGGMFVGKLNGTIIPGGADWNTQIDQYISHASAKYVIKTVDGYYISVENEAVIDDRKAVPFLTKPKFFVDQTSQYAWLNDGNFMGKLSFGERDGEIRIDIVQLHGEG